MADRLPKALGFRSGDKGTHTSRTMMLTELSALLACIGCSADREEYCRAIIEDNVLGKATVSTRKLSAQRLQELYALDRSIPIFRTLARLWDFDPGGQALVALLSALARDPLLRATAPSVTELREGQAFDREAMREKLIKVAGHRLNDSTLDKVLRNAASTWAQSGHLEGRTFKKRTRVRATPGSVVMALFLGYLEGRRGTGILSTFWCSVLDSNEESIATIASSASMSGLLRFRRAGDVMEIGFPELLSAQELSLIHEPT